MKRPTGAGQLPLRCSVKDEPENASLALPQLFQLPSLACTPEPFTRTPHDRMLSHRTQGHKGLKRGHRVGHSLTCRSQGGANNRLL